MDGNSHLTDPQIEAYRRSTLVGDELLSASEHLAVCNFCRERAIPPGVLSARIARLQGQFERHLTDEELISSADGEQLDEPDFVQEHLLNCASCREELAELSLFQKRVKSLLQHQRP